MLVYDTIPQTNKVKRKGNFKMDNVDLSYEANQFYEKYGRKKTVSTFTLGCKVNQYETQALKEKFVNAGYEIVGEGDFADIYMINTCTVTGVSDKKSRQYIRRVKKINPNGIVAVIGCYAQVSPDEAAAIPGVNIVAGTNEKNNLVQFVEEYTKNLVSITHILPTDKLNKYEGTGVIKAMESRTRAYIKVQEGCNRFCSYCIIPYARGNVRSRPTEEILEEAESLLSEGFKEIVLTGINTALYGADLKDSNGIVDIIEKLNKLNYDFRIRIGSLEPTVIDKDYAVNLLKFDKLCHHFHLSLQSGSNKILGAMNRNYTASDFISIVDNLRSVNKHFGITTDIIVGFPGETKIDFMDSLKITETANFLKVHVFKYSKRQGTKAADMKSQVSPSIKAQRSKELIEAADIASKNFFQSAINSVERVLFEKVDEKTGYAFGHTDNYIPVYCKENVNLNNFYMVKLSDVFQDGMTGSILK